MYEIKRSLLENQDGISQQAKDVLLKGIPSMDKTNQFNDILHNSKYKSFIYLRGFEDADSELGPTSPDIHFSPEKMVSENENYIIRPDLYGDLCSLTPPSNTSIPGTLPGSMHTPLPHHEPPGSLSRQKPPLR